MQKEIEVIDNRIEIIGVVQRLTHEDICYQIQLLKDENARNTDKIAELEDLLTEAEDLGLTAKVEEKVEEPIEEIPVEPEITEE